MENHQSTSKRPPSSDNSGDVTVATEALVPSEHGITSRALVVSDPYAGVILKHDDHCLYAFVVEIHAPGSGGVSLVDMFVSAYDFITKTS